MCEQVYPLFYLFTCLFQRSFPYKKMCYKVSFTVGETVLNNITDTFDRTFWAAPTFGPQNLGAYV